MKIQKCEISSIKIYPLYMLEHLQFTNDCTKFIFFQLSLAVIIWLFVDVNRIQAPGL